MDTQEKADTKTNASGAMIGVGCLCILALVAAIGLSSTGGETGAAPSTHRQLPDAPVKRVYPLHVPDNGAELRRVRAELEELRGEMRRAKEDSRLEMQRRESRD